MRRELLVSAVGHGVVILSGALLSAALVGPAPALETIRVDLTSLAAPKVEPPKTVEKPVETPKPEPKPSPPVEETMPKLEIEPDPAPPEPKKDEAALRPPEPDLPRKPAPERKPEPKPSAPKVEEKPAPTPVRDTEKVAESKAQPEDLGRGASVQATASEGVDDAYLRLVQQKIGRRWQPIPALAAGRSNVTVVITFRIGAGGEVIEANVSSPSGLPLFDQRARTAVLDATPLPRPPSRFGAEGLRINFHFVYNP